MSDVFEVQPHDDFYEPIAGSYGRIKKKVIEWHTCREIFLSSRAIPERFLFVASRDGVGGVCGFMDELQKRMKLRKRDRLKVISTNRADIVLVLPGSFWGEKVPLDLLTILLRAGRHYRRKRRFDRTLKDEEYLQETWLATERFLKGYTKFRLRPFYGWRDTFVDMSEKEIDKALVRPKK